VLELIRLLIRQRFKLLQKLNKMIATDELLQKLNKMIATDEDSRP
jgi:hypothetical protein